MRSIGVLPDRIRCPKTRGSITLTPQAPDQMDFRTKDNFVADFLRERVISGQFAPGQRLKQADIASALKLSTTTVRDAQKLQEAEGNVKRESHHANRVTA